MNRRERRAAEKDGGAVVGLRFDTAWCERHLEPIIDEPPAVAVAAMGHMLVEFMADEAVRLDPEIETILDIGPAAHRYSPLCCYLGDEAISMILERAIREGR